MSYYINKDFLQFTNDRNKRISIRIDDISSFEEKEENETTIFMQNGYQYDCPISFDEMTVICCATI